MKLQDRSCFSTEDVKVLKKDTVYKGHFGMLRYHLQHRLMEGGWSRELVRECYDRPPAVGVLLYDPRHDQVVLVEQFRVGAVGVFDNPWQLEMVAGIVEEGELTEDVARRETREEAGATVAELEFICDCLLSPGGSNEKITLYCGRVDASGIHGVHGLESEGEDILAHVVSRDEAWDAVRANLINNASTIIALQWLQLNCKTLQRDWQ